MELRQIEYLLAVLDEGSFTKAASRLKIAQSAVSHQVAKLETELDVTLLRRERPIVTPTPAGEVFVARMRRVVAEIGAAKGEAASLHGRTVGEVSFGATFPAASLDVPEILAGFRAGYPDVRLKLREGTTIELFEMLRTDVIDTALITTELKHLPQGIDGVVVDTDDLHLVGPAGHYLEELPVVPVTALEGLDLISFRRGAGLRAAADRVFESEGVTPNIVIESNEMPLLLGLVASRLGVAVLPRQFVAEPRANIWSRPLSPAIRPSLALAWREGRRFPPAAEAFLRHVVRVAVTVRP